MMETLKVSTMTYVGEIQSESNIKDIYNTLVDEKFHDDLYIENKNNKRNKKGSFIKSFGNQMTIKSKTKKYNIKLFYNNKFQMTGVKSYHDIERIIRELKKCLNVNIYNPRMVMKNVTLKISKNPSYMIHLYNLYHRFIDQGYVVYYTPELYPGLKFKYNLSTALIFATGSIIISTKREDDIYELYNIIDKNIMLL